MIKEVATYIKEYKRWCYTIRFHVVGLFVMEICVWKWLKKGYRTKHILSYFFQKWYQKHPQRKESAQKREITRQPGANPGKQAEGRGRKKLPFLATHLWVVWKNIFTVKKKNTHPNNGTQGLTRLPDIHEKNKDTHLTSLWTTPVFILKAFGSELLFATYLLGNLGRPSAGACPASPTKEQQNRTAGSVRN